MASSTLPRCAHLTSLQSFLPMFAFPRGGSIQTRRLKSFYFDNGTITRMSVPACRAAPDQAPQQEDFFDKVLIQLYERETPVISKLLEDIEKAGLINDTVEDVSGEATTEDDKREVIRRVIDRHWEEMSEAIIMVLAGYAQASYSEGHVQMAATLELLREEVLARSLKQLPPEMQALEHLIGMFDQSSEERVNAVKELGETGRAGVSQCELPALRTTASQMLEDMEEKRGLIDAELLAKLCIVREEIDVAATNLGLYEEGTDYFQLMSVTWRLLPAGNAAFVKELMHVSDANKRRALLAACILDDFQGDKEDLSMQTWVLQGVRPGRLMNTISAIVANLRKEGVEPDSKEWGRLQDIRTTAMELLHEVVT